MAALDEDGVDLVVGSYGSTISAAAAAEAHERGMLLWETGAVGQVDGRRRPGRVVLPGRADGGQPGPGRDRLRPRPTGRPAGRRPPAALRGGLRQRRLRAGRGRGRRGRAGGLRPAAGRPALPYDPWHLDTDGLMAAAGRGRSPTCCSCPPTSTTASPCAGPPSRPTSRSWPASAPAPATACPSSPPPSGRPPWACSPRTSPPATWSGPRPSRPEGRRAAGLGPGPLPGPPRRRR